VMSWAPGRRRAANSSGVRASSTAPALAATQSGRDLGRANVQLHLDQIAPAMHAGDLLDRVGDLVRYTYLATVSVG
jgi:hypothetical protein